MKQLLFACMLFACFSCQKLLIGPVVQNTPVTNFEELWKGYDQWYGGFEVRKINWDSIYQVYRPQVREGMSDEELYDVLCSTIKPFNDIHVFLQPTTKGLPRYESSVFFRENKVQQDFSIDVVREHYLPTLKTIDEQLHYGILDGNIGYIHFGEFGKPVDYYGQQMKTIMQELKGTRAMIVDIRDHAGGDDQVSRYVAGWFAKERKLFMTVRKRNGPERDNFTAPTEWYVDQEQDSSYTKPVVLLTTSWTASAGETFTWAMNTQAHVTHMGDTTAGGFSDVISRELPNGWLYLVGVGDYRNAQGNSEEGKGVAPRIYAVNRKEDIAAGKDLVLEKALDQLR